MRPVICSPVWRNVAVLLTIAVVHFGCTKQAKVDRSLSRGAKHFEAGAYDKARIEYMSALRQGGENPTAIRQLALIWLKQGAPLKALPFLLEAKKANPADMEVCEALPAVMLALGDAASARAEALEVLKQNPANERVLLVLVDSSRTEEEIAQAKKLITRPPISQTATGQAALAVLLLRENRSEEAVQTANKALEIDRNSPDAHVAKAGTYLFLKDLAKSEESFRKASELAPARSSGRVRLAEFLAQTGKLDAAQAEAEKIIAEGDDYLPALLLRVRIMLAKGEYDQALALLPPIMRRDTNGYEGLLLEANIRLKKGETEKAVEVLERLTAAYAELPAPQLLLARAHVQAKNPAKAVSVLEKALAARPQFPEALIMLGEINLRTGKAQAAAEHFRNALTLVPNHSPTKLLLAQSYRLVGRLDDARQLADELRKAMPKWDQPALLLGIVLQQQGKPDEARVALEAASELEPNNLTAVSQLIELALVQNDFASAEARAKQLLERLPTSPAANFLMGRVHAAKGEWDKSEIALRKTLELDPNFSPAYNLLGSTLQSNNRLAEALGQMENVLSKTPENRSALMLTALVREKMQDYTSAREAYEKLIAVAPEFTPALNNLAWLYVEHLNEHAKAYELASKARSLNPTDPSIADTLGWTLFKRGEYQNALTLIQESAGVLGAIPELQYHLGMAQYMMGNPEAARASFEKAMQGPQEFGGKEEVLRHLSMLKGTDSGGGPQSAAALRMAVNANPKDVIALSNLADFYERSGDGMQAAALYRKALDVNPRLGTAAAKLANLYAGPLGDLDAAMEWAKKARQIAPSDPETTATLGRVALAKGDAAWAHGLLKESARQLPKDYRVQAELGWAAYRIGRLDEAKSTMAEIARATPESTVGVEAKQFLHFTALAELPEAIESSAQTEADGVLAKDENFLPALFLKAKYQLKQGGAVAASVPMEGILERNPDFTPAQRELAIFYAQDGRNIDRANELGNKAKRNLLEDLELNRALAYVSYKRKEYRIAIQILERSLEANQLTPDDLFVLGMSHRELKEMKKSREILDKALKAGLSGEKAAEASNLLASEASGA